ncbi:uncharacterized protein LOC135212155 [Macrobrachium nipponense]|uniref:uncharacterized protein LOC135212155 n=1 Tax=Macrobrachium nipponense TaxID=159736 RepID=UPI0030C824FD
MNLIFGTLALLSFRCLGVFGDCVTKPSDTGKFMDSCDSWFTAKESCGKNTRTNPWRYELLFRPASARRYELLVRPDELLVRSEEKDTEVMVDVEVYKGNEPKDENSLAIGTKSSYNASISSDCWMNITVLQPRVSTGNAKVIFSANNTDNHELTRDNVTFLRLKASSPFSVCSRGSQEHRNGHNKNSGSNDEEETRDETPVARKGKTVVRTCISKQKLQLWLNC